jgi:peptidoglycan hydrolase CwlO-like protein
MQQKEKLNELIGAIHEKDELLDSQEAFLIKENKKHVKVKNAYAQEVEKLTNELSTCHDIISKLKFENDKLIAKVAMFLFPTLEMRMLYYMLILLN